MRLLLWALAAGAREETLKLEDLPAPPPDGLTSVSFDRTTPRGFYQAVGYRVSGNRAVRIDMLERLGDLIRDRVYWKSAKEGDQRPEGSVPGGGFTVVPDMMSLVGCSGEDFAGILRGLGFRMDRRPAPAQPSPAQAAASSAGDKKAVEIQGEDKKTAGEKPADGEAAADAAATEDRGGETKEATASIPDDKPKVEADGGATATADAEAATPESQPAETDGKDQSATAETAASPEASPQDAKTATDAQTTSDTQTVEDEPQFIEVWRPRRQSRKPRDENRARATEPDGQRPARARTPWRQERGKEPGQAPGQACRQVAFRQTAQ